MLINAATKGGSAIIELVMAATIILSVGASVYFVQHSVGANRQAVAQISSN